MNPRSNMVARFWAKVEKTEGCWLWRGAARRGYGAFSPQHGTTRPAHRVAWELANSAPIPDGLCVLHRCDNPPCVRPDHLFLGTKKDNAQDAIRKGRRGPKERCIRGHLLTPGNSCKTSVGRTCLLCVRLRTRAKAKGRSVLANYMRQTGLTRRAA